MRSRSTAAFLALAASLVSPLAEANAGLPMLVLAWPAYILAFVPVVVVEALVGVLRLRLSWPTALRTCAIGNLWSTLLGIPIVWLLLLAVEFMVGSVAHLLKLGSAWEYVLFPFMIAWVGGDDVWMVYFAFVLLAVPFCVASILIERKVAVRRLPQLPISAVHGWIRDANIWSYALLVLLALLYPIYISGHAT